MTNNSSYEFEITTTNDDYAKFCNLTKSVITGMILFCDAINKTSSFTIKYDHTFDDSETVDENIYFTTYTNHPETINDVIDGHKLNVDLYDTILSYSDGTEHVSIFLFINKIKFFELIDFNGFLAGINNICRMTGSYFLSYVDSLTLENIRTKNTNNGNIYIIQTGDTVDHNYLFSNEEFKDSLTSYPYPLFYDENYFPLYVFVSNDIKKTNKIIKNYMLKYTCKKYKNLYKIDENIVNTLIKDDEFIKYTTLQQHNNSKYENKNYYIISLKS